MDKYYPLIRKTLVSVTKISVVIILIVILINYAENLYSYYSNHFYLGNDGYYYPYTPITFAIGRYFVAGFTSTFFLFLLSVSLRFCWRHQLGIYYMFALLIQRHFNDYIYTSNTAFLFISYLNIAVILLIIFINVKQLIKNNRGVVA